VADVELVLGVAVLAIGTYAFRIGGVGLSSQSPDGAAERWSDVAVVVLLASVTATSALYDNQHFAGWARVVGVLVAAALAWMRLPLVIIVLSATVATASIRLLESS
jgi:uncharacterized membrane protein